MLCLPVYFANPAFALVFYAAAALSVRKAAEIRIKSSLAKDGKKMGGERSVSWLGKKEKRHEKGEKYFAKE